VDIDTEALSVEVGRSRRGVHGHFVLNITHNGKVNTGHVQRELQDYFSTTLGRPGCYVRAQLLPSSQFKNYASKHAGTSTGRALPRLETRTLTFGPE
jgi:hypothetical protein